MSWRLDQEYLWQGRRLVYLAPPAQKEWRGLDAARRAGMRAVVDKYARQPDAFPEYKLVQEGRHKLRGKTVLLLAFKDGDVRMYCALVDLHQPSLLVVAVVTTKKRNKLDPTQATKAIKRLEKFLDEQEKE